MSNYTMQCRKCHVHTDYSSKTDLCDACEINLLRSRLTIAEETLKAIEEDSKTGTVSAQTFHEALNYLRSINTIAREGLKRMEEVRN